MHGKHEIEFWGAALVRWPLGLAERAGLPPSDCEYLHHVGLPVSDDWTIRIEVPTDALEDKNGFVVVAFDGPTPIGVDPVRPLRVIAAEGNGDRSVNSTIAAFGRFLMFYERYRREVRGVDEDAAMSLVDETEAAMRAADPAAMADEDFYWPTVVEQMRDGLL